MTTYIVHFCSDIDRNSLRTAFNGRNETFGTLVQNRPCVRWNGLKDSCIKLCICLTIARLCAYFPILSILDPVLLLFFTKYHCRGIILRLTTLRQIAGVSINPLPVPSSKWVQWLHCEYTDDYRSGRNNFRRYIEPPRQSIHLSSPCNYDVIMHRNWQLSSLLLMQPSTTYSHALAKLSLCLVKHCGLKKYRE
jgi:hypothetical protein